MSPDLRLRLHATQAQPCFPAASNALALPGGNGIFTATPTERITHYTLLRKVVCQMGALPPLETPTRKGGTLPLHGAHTAFSCYPALRLYRLSKSPRGIDVVSLTLGNSRLPFIDRAGRHAQAFGQLLLRESVLPAQRADIFRKSDLHIHPSRCLYRIRYRAGMKHTIHMIRTEIIHTNSMDFGRHCRKTSCGAEVPVVFLPGIWYDE